MSHENILIYEILYRTLIESKSLRIRFDKIFIYLLEFMTELDI